MPFLPVHIKPGPKSLAAALRLAGFNDSVILPPVKDACSVTWANPNLLQTALAVAGGESSGDAVAYHVNEDCSTDYGLFEINNRAHPVFFLPPGSPFQLMWSSYAQNAVMAFKVYTEAGNSFAPWRAYTGGGYLAERYARRSWMDWADYGVKQMNIAVSALELKGVSYVAALNEVASVSNDPLEYWS